MTLNRGAGRAATLMVIVLLLWSRPAWAYIDPNTGGLLFNWLAGSLVAISGGILLLGGYIRSAVARTRRVFRERFAVGRSRTTHRHPTAGQDDQPLTHR